MRRFLTVACLGVLLGGAATAQAAGETTVAGAAGGTSVARDQELVVLRGAHDVRTAPQTDASKTTVVAVHRPLTDTPTVLPVLGQTIDSVGRSWLQVRLPGRVLKHKAPPASGWILAEKTVATSTPWHIVIDLSARRVVVYNEGRAVHRYPAVVGRRSTPTPSGEFFVEESVRVGKGEAGGPFALATSARSRVFQEFEGGPGQVAIHGTAGLAGAPGTAASHGCVRVAGSAIAWLAAHVDPGTPITIR